MSFLSIVRLTAIAAGVIAGARPAAADGPIVITDPDAAEAALPSPHHSLLDLAVLARYDRLPGDVHGARAGLSARAVLGRRLGYSVGADLELGGSAEGVAYRAAVQLVGVGWRVSDASFIAASGGVGVGGARGIVPAALELPVELRARFQAGPVRLSGWVVGRLTALSDARDGGSRVDGVDELEATLAVGWGTQRRYWRGSSAGSGPYVAVTYRELLGERVVSVALGVELLGAE